MKDADRSRRIVTVEYADQRSVRGRIVLPELLPLATHATIISRTIARMTQT